MVEIYKLTWQSNVNLGYLMILKYILSHENLNVNRSYKWILLLEKLKNYGKYFTHLYVSVALKFSWIYMSRIGLKWWYFLSDTSPIMKI